MKIDEELRRLIPPLSDEERAGLEADIIRDGRATLPLIVWQDILLDGHNRLEICEQHCLPYTTQPAPEWVKDRVDARMFIRNTALHRHNLGPITRAELVAGNEADLALQAAERKAATQAKPGTEGRDEKGRVTPSPVQKNFSAPEEREKRQTRTKAAKQAGMSHPTYEAAKYIAAHGTPELKAAADRGEVAISAAAKVAELAPEKQRTVVAKGKKAVSKAAKEVTTAKSTSATAKPAEDCQFNWTPGESIEWARWSWNPIWGCQNICTYCYARDIGKRFVGHFNPTWHPNRLKAPANTKHGPDQPNKVFTGSMGDMFGPWVPDEQIAQVFEAMRDNPQWTYLFLTKYPARYLELTFPPNTWVGATIDGQSRVHPTLKVMRQLEGKAAIRWISFEPLQERLTFTGPLPVEWAVIGGRSKTSGASEFHPPVAWIGDVMDAAHDIPVYWKPNLGPKGYPQP